MKRGLHRPGRRRQRLRNLLERQIERVLEDDRRTLLRRQLPEDRPGGFARDERIARGGRSFVVLPERLFVPTPSQLVEPEVRGDPEEPRPRVRRRVAHLPERHERARHGVLREILGVPGAPREVAAVAIEVGAERLVGVEEALPGRAKHGRERLGGSDRGAMLEKRRRGAGGYGGGREN